MGRVSTIGIVGGGQLGRMLTLAAKPLGFHVIVIDPSPNSPAAQVGAEEITANLYDESALLQLADVADYITVEIEHLDADILKKLVKHGKHINPDPQTIRLIQDKYAQKEFLQKNGIPTTAFMPVTNAQEAEEALVRFGGRMLIKTRHGAYDGRGNMIVNNKAGIQRALTQFGDFKLYAEAFVPFKKELAVMIARGLDGTVAAYPVVETKHERSICVEVQAPADVSKKSRDRAIKIAHQVAVHLRGAGVFGIEMFLTGDGEILINEVAPRVHNSGHYTIEACRTSQFEQHIRAITGLPLGDTDMVVPAAAMVNILGQRNGPIKPAGLAEALAVPQTSIHIYGKSPTKIDRKMGHITATANTIKQALNRARSARKKVSI